MTIVYTYPVYRDFSSFWGQPMMQRLLFPVLVFLSASVMAHSIRFAGSWEGDAQFQLLSQTGQVVETVPVPVLVLHVGPHGEIAGEITGNGCEFEGGARVDRNEASMTLGFTLFNCNQAGYSGNYTGTFRFDSDARNAVVTMTMVSPGTSTNTVRISATLHPL